MLGSRRRRREQELAALDRWRVARRLVEEDVTVLGEQLADLHLDTLVDDLADDAAQHYRRALELYDQAKHLVTTSSTAEDLLDVAQVAADARWRRGAVLALRDGDPLPERREPCFFDPRHGPSVSDVAWTPSGGVARTVAVCAEDARRLAAGDEPLVRLVRVGDRWVPWHRSGGAVGIVDAYGHQGASSAGVHVQQAYGEAYLNQSLNGPNGAHGSRTL